MHNEIAPSPLSSHGAPTRVSFLEDEDGATAIEYGLIASLVCIIIVTGLSILGAAMGNMYGEITNAVEGAMN